MGPAAHSNRAAATLAKPRRHRPAPGSRRRIPQFFVRKPLPFLPVLSIVKAAAACPVAGNPRGTPLAPGAVLDTAGAKEAKYFLLPCSGRSVHSVTVDSGSPVHSNGCPKETAMGAWEV
jgi:hypothetical protein